MTVEAKTHELLLDHLRLVSEDLIKIKTRLTTLEESVVAVLGFIAEHEQHLVEHDLRIERLI